jgi:hypothetical protein
VLTAAASFVPLAPAARVALKAPGAPLQRPMLSI